MCCMIADYCDIKLDGFQVKNFYVGSDFVGDVPLTKKILAALTTGELNLPMFRNNLKEKFVYQNFQS